MFLLEYSLSVKRDEIKKLDEIARQREEAIKTSEKLLDENAARFDAFLKENNLKTMEATRRYCPLHFIHSFLTSFVHFT
jgi:hypothetical protein